MDKRFWSGAVVVLTVVVAGSSALPRLLLQPALDEPAEIVPPAPFVSRPVAPAAVSQPTPRSDAEPVTATPVVPASVTVEVKLGPPSVPQAKTPAVPTPQPASQASSPAPPSPPAVRPADPSPFPPVQPIDVADRPNASPKVVADAAPNEAQATSVARQGSERRREKIVRAAVQPDTARRRRHVRPAAYPIREFLAWHR